MNQRKAQAWGFDVIVATGIFIFGMVVFYIYTINYPNGEQEKFDDLLYEGNIIADNLFSEGYPENWTILSVSKIGLTSKNKINQDKLEEFYDLVSLDYSRTKSLFGVKYNYFVNFSQPIVVRSSNVEGIGFAPDNPNNNIKISRIIVYNNKPATMEIQVWD